MGGVFLVASSLSTILLLSLFLSILPSTNKGRADENTGQATINNVNIIQAGTGQSVTIDGKTIDENQYGTNTSRRTILNNNIVRYGVNLAIIRAGQITMTATLPVNNTFDKSSISRAAGCQDGSKLEAVSIGGQTSHTTNRAVCIIKADSLGAKTWALTANLWGGSNAKITPTLAVNGQFVATHPDTIAVVGMPNYRINTMQGLGDTFGSTAGVNRKTVPTFGLYIPASDTGILGVEPINSFQFSVDMSKMPSGWGIYTCADWLNAGFQFTGGTVNGSDAVKCNRSADGQKLTFSATNIVTALPVYPNQSSAGAVSDYYYLTGGAIVSVPVSQLTTTSVRYNMAVGSGEGQMISGEIATIDQASSAGLSVWLKNLASALPALFSFQPGITETDLDDPTNYAMPGWNGWWTPLAQPLYGGESYQLTPSFQQNSTLEDAYSGENYYCFTWNPTLMTPTGNLAFYKKFILDSSTKVEYGVIGSDTTKRPSAYISNSCGKVGDGQAGFFTSLAEAQSYAASKNLKVNAIRLYADKIDSTNLKTKKFANIPFRVLNGDGSTDPLDSIVGKYKVIIYGATAVSKDWDADGRYSSDSSVGYYNPAHQVLVPGLLRHTISARPASGTPNSQTHITITPYTYNRDNDTKITTTLPVGLSIKQGSVRWGDRILSDGEDYTITNNDDGTTTIVFNTGAIGSEPTTGADGLPVAADNNGKGVARVSIEFDVVISDNVDMPSTLHITSTTSGEGTDLASQAFRSATADVSVANDYRFGYNLTTSADTIGNNDSLEYVYSSYNTSGQDLSDLDGISVMPYNGDYRGTSRLDNTSPYAVASIKRIVGDDLSISYTTDLRVRQYENSGDEAAVAKLATDSSIVWAKCVLANDGSCSNLPKDSAITAIRWQRSTMSNNYRTAISVEMSNVKATGMGYINSDISYLSVGGITPVVHTAAVSTTVRGEDLGLIIDKPDLQVSVEPGSANLDATNNLQIMASTDKGWTLTAAAKSGLPPALKSSDGGEIPTKDGEPVAGSPLWALRSVSGGTNTDWHALPASDATPLALTTGEAGNTAKTVTMNYGVATDSQVSAGLYTTTIVYTVTTTL